MEGKKIAAAIALSVLLIVGGAGTLAFAYKGDSTVQGPNYSPDRHAAMQAAFESGNYSAWKSLMDGVKGRSGSSPRILSVVTEENFEEFAQAHLSGEMSDFRSAYGLSQGIRKRDGSGQGAGNGQGMMGNHKSW